MCGGSFIFQFHRGVRRGDESVGPNEIIIYHRLTCRGKQYCYWKQWSPLLFVGSSRSVHHDRRKGGQGISGSMLLDEPGAFSLLSCCQILLLSSINNPH
jgi:hypothetical protein